jgi:hypothetical protein
MDESSRAEGAPSLYPDAGLGARALRCNQFLADTL